MPLLITCPITEFCYKLENGSSNTSKISVRHPLLSCSLQELNEIEFCKSNSLQGAYLFTAYLWQVNLLSKEPVIHWHSALPASQFSTLWLLQKFNSLKLLVNWLAVNRSNSLVANMPGLRIDAATRIESIQSWLEACLDRKRSYERMPTQGERERRLWEANLNKPISLDLPDNNPKIENANLTRTRLRRQYIAKSLHGQSDDRIQLVTRVIARPNEYELVTIKQVKALCLDFLLEDSQEHWNEKEAIIRKLDQVLWDKTDVLISLDLPDAKKLREDLESNYTIMVNGKAHENSLLNRGTTSAIPAPVPAPKIYTSEPKREDFKLEIAYQIAMRQWKKQQESSK